MHLSYSDYLDKIYGGWIGKSAGGAIGARFEGFKGWVEINPAQLFPKTMPPNDDLDLQVLWLAVLEEKGPAVTADDLAQAWLRDCWYPFNEYGNFRRNYRLGIKPPTSGDGPTSHSVHHHPAGLADNACQLARNASIACCRGHVVSPNGRGNLASTEPVPSKAISGG
ncbi:MAG TPA: hypothetical protein EYP04_07400 [Anaerolineae bacterium]|nr:hypothetical protein [Anaerolineae bacterium]HIQ06019.1 hypothetical protein [Anaerolineae bacterium]